MRAGGVMLGGALLVAAGNARADDAGGFLLPGVLWGPGAAKSVGAEVSYAYYPDGCCVAVGPLVQAEWLRPRDPRGGTFRTALGAQAMVAGLGVEAAFTYQGARSSGEGAGPGTSLGAFLSLGFASIGIRRTQPFAGGDPPETTVVMTFKWMILVYGETPYRFPTNFMAYGSGRQGRPLLLVSPAGSLELVACVAELRCSDDWAALPSTAVGGPRALSGSRLRARLLRALDS